MKQQGVNNHYYNTDQARLLLNILKNHNASTLCPHATETSTEAIDAALDKLRLELTDYIVDDGVGSIAPTRDEKGLA